MQCMMSVHFTFLTCHVFSKPSQIELKSAKLKFGKDLEVKSSAAIKALKAEIHSLYESRTQDLNVKFSAAVEAYKVEIQTLHKSRKPFENSHM